MDEDYQQKMDSYNEMLLKSTALTFSREGLSRDIKLVLTRKAEFVAEMLNGIAALIEGLPKYRHSKKRTEVVDNLLEHAFNEVRMVNTTMNFVLARLLQKESDLTQEASPPTKPTRHVRREKK